LAYLKGKDHVEDLSVDGKIFLKRILKRYGLMSMLLFWVVTTHKNNSDIFTSVRTSDL
jgi:hypothetical protein